MLNVLDIIIAIPLLYGAYKGFNRGFIIEIASIVGLITGIYCGIYFSDYAAALIREYSDMEGTVLEFWAFLLTFLMVIVVVHLIGTTLEKVANLVALKLVNKLMGAGFGMLKFAIIIAIMLVIVESIDQRFQFLPQHQKNSSRLYKPFADAVSLVVPGLKDVDWHYEEWRKEILDEELTL